jgi:hypothetical protein
MATTETPANPDEYQGWRNRETWAAALWLDNTEPLYRANRELAAECRREGAAIAAEGNARHQTTAYDAEAIAANLYADRLDLEELAAEYLTDPRDGTPAGMLHDIGSTWRIDYRELYAAAVEE